MLPFLCRRRDPSIGGIQERQLGQRRIRIAQDRFEAKSLPYFGGSWALREIPSKVIRSSGKVSIQKYGLKYVKPLTWRHTIYTLKIITVKLGYDKHAWDRLILLVIAVIRYNCEGLCTKLTIWEQKFQPYSFVIAVNS